MPNGEMGENGRGTGGIERRTRKGNREEEGNGESGEEGERQRGEEGEANFDTSAGLVGLRDMQ